MEILLTLSSGLEFVRFEVNLDLPGHDLGKYTTRTESDASSVDNEDRISLYSVASSAVSFNNNNNNNNVPFYIALYPISSSKICLDLCYYPCIMAASF